MTASDVMKAAKQAQVRESIDRGGRSPDAQQNRELNQAALDVAEDTNVPIDEPGSHTGNQQEAEPKPFHQERQRSPFEERRANIIANFRQKRVEDSSDTDENSKDIRRLTRDGMPPELVPIADVDAVTDDEPVAEEPVEAPVEAPVTATEQPQAKVKIKVRGKELEVTQDELLAYAQKGAAGDDYLDEARRKLDEVNALTRDIRTRVSGQPSTTDTHPAGDQTQPNADATQPETGDAHHVDPFFRTAETMQLGTPEEAATNLRTTVEETATRAASAALERERLRDEVARSGRYLKTFQDENQDLAKDTKAHAVLERTLYDLQVEDIKALGIDEAQLPKTPTDIANWHLWYRANGYKVRNIPDLLNTARDEVNEWRGVKKPSAQTTEQAKPKTEPRVEVTVDRTQRRAAIPQQPSRTVAPKQPTTQAQAQPRDRSSVVQDMIAARAKPRGRIVG